MAQCITSCSSSSNRAIKAMAPVGGVDHSAKICQINMKFISLSLLCVLLLSLLLRNEAAPSGQLRVRSSKTTSVRVTGNANIRWNGNCNNCDIRTSRNSAQVTSTQRREYSKRW